jgi:hypothetical protein
VKVTSNQTVSVKKLIARVAKEAATEITKELSMSGVLTAENIRLLLLNHPDLLRTVIKSGLKTVILAGLRSGS